MERWWKWMGPALVAAALGCGGGGGGGTPPSQEGLHRSCAPGSQCATGQQCLEYTGIAGPLASCEIPCQSRSDCPRPLDCVSVADGPSQLICD